jgi:hypothetical protein
MTQRSPRKGDAAQQAWAVVAEATGQIQPEPEKDPAAVARGRAGGIARAKKLTPERRHEIAMLGVEAKKEATA